MEDSNVKKKLFLEAYAKTFGNMSASCEMAGIKSLQTYYNWKKNDPEFVEKLNQIDPNLLIVDFAESALMKRIAAGDTTAIIFCLKTKGKDRGYVEKQSIELNTENTTKPTIIIGKIEEDGDSGEV